MARYPQNTPEIEHLIRLSAASRSQLSLQAATLRQRLDVPARVLLSLRRHPAAWLGGVAAAALAVPLMLRRRAAPPTRRRGWGGLLGSLALNAVRPLVKSWLAAQLQQFVIAQLQPALMARSRANPAERAAPPHSA